MAGKYNLNLNVLLKHLDSQNMEVYEAYRHKEVERKELERLLGYILPIWFSAISNSRDQYEMVFRFNEVINTGWYELRKHPELQAKLLAAIGPGKPVQHDFHARKLAGRHADLSALLTLSYPDLRPEEVGLWCTINNEANLLELCDRHGIQSKERDSIVSEYRRVVS